MPIAPPDARLAHRGREATRQRILDAAVIVFSGLGSERATMKEVAARCGLTDAAIYYYFKSKQQLLDAALAQRWRLPHPHAAGGEPEAPRPTTWAELSSAVDLLLDIAAENEPTVTLLEQEAFVTPAARAALMFRSGRARETLRQRFDHRFSAEDAAAFADSIFLLVAGAIHLARARQHPPLADAIRDPAFRERLHDLVRVCAPVGRVLGGPPPE